MNQYPEQAASISLADVLHGMGRRKLLMLTTCLLGLGVGLAISKLASPVYQTEARIVLESSATSLDGGQTSTDINSRQLDDRVVATQATVISSHDLADRIVDSLNLATKPEFVPSTVEVGSVKEFAIDWGFADDKRKLTQKQRAVAKVLDALTVYPIPQSNVIGIKVSTDSPVIAADIANAIAETYVLSTQETQSGSVTRAEKWITDQIEILRQKVVESEGAVEKFRTQAGLLKGATTTLVTEDVSQLRQELSQAEAAQTDAIARAREIRSQLQERGSVDAGGSVLSSPTIENLQQQRIAVNRQLTELSATYLENHPKIIAASKQLREIDTQLRREALKVVDGLDSQAKIASARAKSLQAALEKVKGRQSEANFDDIKLKALEREAAANRSLLESMLLRLVDAGTRKDPQEQPSLARVIQRASVPTAISFPRKGPIVLLSTLGGLMSGMGLAFLLSMMGAATRGKRYLPDDQTRNVTRKVPDPRPNEPAFPPARSPDSIPPVEKLVEADTEVEHIIPPERKAYSQSQPELSRWGDDSNLVKAKSVAAMQAVSTSTDTVSAAPLVPSLEPQDLPHDEAASIAEGLMRIQTKSGSATFAFARVGCRPLDSALAVMATARELASYKKRVLVLDLDQQRGDLEAIFNLPDGPGLFDLLSGTADFTRIVNRDPKSSVQIVRLGEVENAPSREELAQKVNSILNSMKGIYDFVILNCGEASPETHSMITACDASVLVAPPTHDEQSHLAAETLSSHNNMPVLQVTVDQIAND